jgi:hypothetical protein
MHIKRSAHLVRPPLPCLPSDVRAVGKAGPEAAEEGSNEEWTHPLEARRAG